MPPETTTVDGTRAKLLHAAKGVFSSKGYHGARVSDIVRAAGVAQGTFYLHFTSKETVFRELVDGFYAGVFEQAQKVSSTDADRTPSEAVEAVHNVWLSALHAFRRDRDLARMILREAHAVEPDVSDLMQQYYATTVDALVACVRGTPLNAMVRDLDLDLVGWAVVGMFERVAYQKIVLEGRDDVERIADQLFRLELRGLLRDDAAMP